MRVLVLLQPGRNSRSIFLGLVRGLARAGHEPLVLELAPFWEALGKSGAHRSRVMTEAASALRGLMREHRPDASIAMWGNALTTFAGGVVDGAPRSVFGILDLPHCCWWLDAPQWAAEGTWAAHFAHPMLRCPSLVHVVNNSETSREMAEILGFGRTVDIPYGVDEEVFRPFDEPRMYDLVVSCGPGDPPPSAIALRELASDQPDIRAIRRDAAVRARESIDRFAPPAIMPLVDHLIAAQLERRDMPVLLRVRRAAEEDASLAPAVQALVRDPRLYVKVAAAVRGIEAFERPFTIAWLSRRFKMATFGNMTTSWPVEAEHLGEIPFEEMPRIYSRAVAGLNVMRWQDDIGINLKPFEISACGVPCIMSSRAGMEFCFATGQIIATDGPCEVAESVASLRDDSSRREQVAQAALARVRAEHTWTHRAARFVAAMAR